MARTWYAVIGTSPFYDTSVAAGPYRSSAGALIASHKLTSKGWNAEVVELLPHADIPEVGDDAS